MQEEKRRARRVHFPQPIEARLSDTPVSLIDLSASGASIQHNESIPPSIHRRFDLEFEYQGELFSLPCQVARSRVDHLRSAANRMVYTSGLRFTEVSDPVGEALWRLLGNLAASDPEIAPVPQPQPVRIIAQ